MQENGTHAPSGISTSVSARRLPDRKALDSIIAEVNAGLSDEERKLIMSVKELAPDWSVNDYSHYPSVKWKLYNLEKLRSANPAKHAELAEALRGKLWPAKV